MSAFTRYWLRTREQKIEDAAAVVLFVFSFVVLVGMGWIVIHFARKFW